MILKDILAISGEPGLFRFIAQGKNSLIVEHLETKKRSSAFGSSKVSSLEDIAIFTDNEDIPLSKVFDLIFEKANGGPAIDGKTDDNKFKAWFEGILPDYDKTKVYTSDIKKVAIWYNILHRLNLLVKEKAETIVAEDEADKPDKKEKAAPKRKKKPSAPESEK
jgi:hypothetical protein